MRRVYCLYRVSTEQQVEKHDIPMQREACHAFAEEKGWSIEKEYYERGVLGFKVSAEKRDAIQEIKCAVSRREFDVLLVFMFDRLGRRDDETPFVVEWFVRNGIAVWSVKEGEQRFDSHIDKLLNYIQFWQASGESIKISIRTKANVIRMIYQKYVFEGMGTHRIARYLTAQGISSSTEDYWHSHSISHILQNPMLFLGLAYCGYCGKRLIRGTGCRRRLRKDGTETYTLRSIESVNGTKSGRMRTVQRRNALEWFASAGM